MKTITFFITSALLSAVLLLSGCNRAASPTTPESGNASAAPSNIATEKLPRKEEFNTAIQSLTFEVSDMISRVENTMPTGTAEEQQTQFFDLKNDVEALENRLDDFDDSIEHSYKNDGITQEEYTKLEQELENLEDLLEASENKLEFTFGMDS